jgi:hypothetical protein
MRGRLSDGDLCLRGKMVGLFGICLRRQKALFGKVGHTARYKRLGNAVIVLDVPLHVCLNLCQLAPRAKKGSLRG